MSEKSATAEHPTLTLIEGAGGEPAFGLAPQKTEADWIERTIERSLPRRAGDHVEAWIFDDGAKLKPIRRVARDRGLNADTAVALVIERRLILGELKAAGLGGLEKLLDRSSEEARPTIELWSAHNAYLRHLLHGDDLERLSNLPLASPRAALPIRLIDRLGDRSPLDERATRPAEVERAIEWEVAALRRGVLMGEWAYRCVLLDVVGHSPALGTDAAY